MHYFKPLNVILVVAGERSLSRQVATMLDHHGYTVHACDDMDAIDYMEIFNPDLLILDENMSLVSVTDLIIRKNEDGFKNLPTIVCSTLKDYTKTYECCIDEIIGVIRKPLNSESFHNNVMLLWHLHNNTIKQKIINWCKDAIIELKTKTGK